jgi:uncharacterized protein DUF4177
MAVLDRGFEYKVLQLRIEGKVLNWYHGRERLGHYEALEQILNTHGKEGWEVVGVTRPFEQAQHQDVILKRHHL